jgi:hypothetical protein
MKLSLLLKKKRKNRLELMLVAAVNSLSVQKPFVKMTPEEVFKWLEARAVSLFI